MARGRFEANTEGIAALIDANTNSANAPDGDMMTSARTMSIPAVQANVLADSGFITGHSESCSNFVLLQLELRRSIRRISMVSMACTKVATPMVAVPFVITTKIYRISIVIR